MSRRRPSWMHWEILLLALSLSVNFAFLAHDLPDVTHPDEPKVVRRAIAMGTGDLNPHFFVHPTLWIYCVFVAQGIGIVLGLAFGVFEGMRDLESRAFVDPSYFFVAARILTATVGTATAWASWCLARRFGLLAGIIASTLVTISPAVVQYAHIATPDIPMAFTVLLVLTSSLNACTHPKDARRWLLLSAVCAGLASSIKYNGSVSLACVVAATVVSGRRNASSWHQVIATALGAIAVSLLTLVATSPFIILDWPTFLTGLAAVNDGSIAIQGSSPDDLYYVRLFLSQFGPLAVVASLAGGALLARGHFGPEGRTFLLVGLALLLPYAIVLHLADDKQIRHILPIIPIVATTAGCTGQWIFQQVSTAVADHRMRPVTARILMTVIVVTALVQPVTSTTTVVRTFAERSAPSLAAHWLRDHLSRSTPTYIDTHSSVTLPPDRETVEARIAVWQESADPAAQHLARIYTRYLACGAADRGFSLLPTTRLGLNSFTSGYDVDLDYAISRLDSVSCVVAPDWSLRSTGRKQRDEFYRRMQQRFRMVHVARDSQGRVVVVFYRD